MCNCLFLYTESNFFLYCLILTYFIKLKKKNQLAGYILEADRDKIFETEIDYIFMWPFFFAAHAQIMKIFQGGGAYFW